MSTPSSLDQYVDGLTRDCSDHLVSFVHEAVLGSDRGWVNWEQVLEARLSLFTLWCNVWLRFSFAKNSETNSFSVSDCWC